MKLLTVIPSYWPAFQFGGPIPIVHNLNKALVRKGIDVTVYTTNAGLDNNVPVNKEITLDGVKLTYFSYAQFFDFLGATGWHFSLPMTLALKRKLNNFDIIYILAVWNYPVATAAHFCRMYKKPYIVCPLGALYPYLVRKKSWKKLLYYYLVSRRDLKFASAIHYATEDEAENCHSVYGLNNESIVIPYGIDPKEFNSYNIKDTLRSRYPYLNRKKVIIFLSRINWKKGLDILIEAYALLSRERDDVHLLIAGNDDEGYGKNVKKLIRDNRLRYIDCQQADSESNGSELGKIDLKEIGDRKVTFTGMLKGEEKFEALSGSDVFVLPSYSENFGMAVIEAMACGVPVVISNKVGIHREVESCRAGIVVENDLKNLYESIKILLDNESLREEITRNAFRLVRDHYDINKVADMMINSYEGILTNARRSNE
jgi:glycosyltransferase involved in cell wall biosynthesis